MQPVVFTIPWLNRDVPGYGLMLMIAFMAAILWAARRAMRSGANPDVILNCGFIALIAGVVGCRAMYVVHYWDQFKNRGDWLAITWAIIDVTRGGLEFYGGFMLATVVVLAYLILWKHSIRWYMDIIAPSAALGLAIGRIGCFLNGCCYGGTCELPWAVQFPFGSSVSVQQWKEKVPGSELRKELLVELLDTGVHVPLQRESLAASDEQIAAAEAAEKAARAKLNSAREKLAAAGAGGGAELRREVARAEREAEAAAGRFGDIRANMKKYNVSAAQLRAWAGEQRSVPVHPTQLYSTVTALLLALFLDALYWRRTRDGQVICALFVLEPGTRWLLEVIRADNPVDTAAMFTISQFLAICMIALGVAGLLVLRTMSPRSPRAVRWEPPDAPAAGKPAATG